MILFVQDFAWFAVVLRALLLTLQTLTLGGVVFLAFLQPGEDIPAAMPRCLRWLKRASIALAAVGAAYVVVNSTVLMISVGLHLRDLLTADYFVSGCITAALGVEIAVIARRCERRPSAILLQRVLPALALGLMVNDVFTSHAVSRMENRWLLAAMTLVHQLAAAAWLGVLPFLLMAMRAAEATPERMRPVLRRFTYAAVSGAVALAVTGVVMSWFYVGSAPALYGTAYGVMVVSKAIMLLLLVAMGAMNFRTGRLAEFGRGTLALLRRFTELELIAAFSLVLMAASLTSQPPGIDLVEGRLTPAEIADHFKPRMPVLQHPPLESLAPATSAEEAALHPDDLERAAAHTNRDPDLAWSEFEHNWAGIFLIAIGVMGVIAATPGGQWARFWPLIFIVMSIFLMIFSDPENWPLGPIGYWQSFSDPEVLVHRVALSFLIIFGIFETGVQTGRLALKWGLVFPTLSVAAASAFLVHTHALGNVKLELLTEISHTPISVLGILAGALRLVQIWLTADRARLAGDSDAKRLDGPIRFAAIAWPLCMLLAGVVLVNYREG